MEQIRLVKEMRENDKRSGRTDEFIRPRYMVWENVPGAFSSNQGKDFAAVIEEAIKVAEPEAPNVPVPEKGWPTSGCFMGDNWSVAWRVLDAQFWGVPQRRRRIALVADFGGQSAPEILFIRKGVSRDIDESESARKTTAGDAQDCTGADDRAGAVGFPLGFRPENVRCYDEVATTLCNGTRPGFTTGVIQPVAADSYLFENHSQDTRYKGPLEVSPMLSAQPGTGGNNTPLVMEPVTLEPGISVREVGHIYEGVSGTLRAKAVDNQMPIAYGVDAYNQTLTGDKSKTLNAIACDSDHIPVVIEPASFFPQRKAESQCFRNDGVNNTLTNGTNPGFQNAIVVPQGTFQETGFGWWNDENVGATLRAMSGGDAMKANLVVERYGRYIVRRLTPGECEALQGFPKGWTDIGEWVDSKGKKHKEADSPRYKALGNSIALPPWKWVLKRLCACYERDATMASLFDGIGGFPYIWEQLNGKGSCLWASEIEEFPMAVTKLRFGG
jgi:DNA (cytosine-5)-methyltransferase 1